MHIQKRKAFTLVELITVTSIVALLLAMVVPAMNVARKKARVVACKSMITSIETGLEQFRNDQGFYPSSTNNLTSDEVARDLNVIKNSDTSKRNLGAHKMAEALFGYDKLGYQENHWYEICDDSNDSLYGKPVKRESYSDTSFTSTIRNSYLSTDNVVMTSMSEVADAKGIPTASNADCWGNVNPLVGDGLKGKESLPLLYYKANKRGVRLAYNNTSTISSIGIYDFDDNYALTQAALISKFTTCDMSTEQLSNFSYYVFDPRTTGTASRMDVTSRPYKKDSFVIISAGIDGLYGTDDDICNFDVANDK